MDCSPILPGRRRLAFAAAVLVTPIAVVAAPAAATTPPVPTTEPTIAPTTAPTAEELVNPVALIGDSGITITDGRASTTVPHTGAVARAADGTIIVVGDDLLSTVAPTGTISTTACAGCRGVVEYDGTIYTGRDPQTEPDGFAIETFELATLRSAGTISASRSIDPEDYPDNQRQYFDVPLVIGADEAGVVVAYDYQPGGFNSRGGGELVIARHDAAGTQVAMTITAGRADEATDSPDGLRSAVRLGGSGGTCVSVSTVVKVDLDTLAVTAGEDLGGSSWVFVLPLWDADSSLRTTGVRFDQSPDGDAAADCGLQITPWESRLDAAGSWIAAPTAGTTRWIGPGCDDVVTVTPSFGETGLTFAATATVGGAMVDLGQARAVALGTSAPSYCAAA